MPTDDLDTTIRPWTLAVSEEDLIDLHRRLDAIRWPDASTVTDASQGPPLQQLQRLVDHWRNGYDWRRCEADLNRLGQYRTTIDGLDLYFLHVRSSHPQALPLLMCHGWPGSVLEFRSMAATLTDPTTTGGAPVSPPGQRRLRPTTTSRP